MPVLELTIPDADNDFGWSFDRCSGYVPIQTPPLTNVAQMALDFWQAFQILGIADQDGSHSGTIHRYTNVTIPQGATINDARFLIAITSPFETTGEDEPGSDFRVSAEDVDDSAVLTNGIAGGARTLTTAFRSGPGEPFGVYGVESWLEQRGWTQPSAGTGIANVIQEVVNRPGWVSGNALSIITSGEFANGQCAPEGQMWIAAYGNTKGEEANVGEVSPRLVIDYTDPVPPTIRAAPIII